MTTPQKAKKPAAIVKDPHADLISLKAEDLFSVKNKTCVVTGGSKG